MSIARPGALRVLFAVGLAAALILALLSAVEASSHREAPLITEDPVADNTDVYAFVAPDAPDSVTLVADFVPFAEPAGGPNFSKFGDDVLYAIHLDNDGDAVADLTYEFRFTTRLTNPDTFLYNTGPITYDEASGTYENWTMPQSYTVSRVHRGRRTVLGSNLRVPPVDVGVRSTQTAAPYDSLVEPAIHTLSDGSTVFAGPRDDPFWVDLGSIFDLGGLRPFNPAHLIPLPQEAGKDAVAGYNTHSIVLQVPKSEVVGDDDVIGVYSTASRQQVRVLDRLDGASRSSGRWVQVSRLGMPLVNEVVVPLGDKDRFNASEPRDDAQFLDYVTDPELGRLLPVLYPDVFSCQPSTPRNDLVAIFLTGLEGVNQPQHVTPSEMIRLNTATPPTPFAEQSRLGLLGGDPDGFPNGRRLVDDVVDISLKAVAGAAGECAGQSPNQDLTDGVLGNDLPFSEEFPYLAAPHSGYDNSPGQTYTDAR